MKREKSINKLQLKLYLSKCRKEEKNIFEINVFKKSRQKRGDNCCQIKLESVLIQ